MALMEEFRPSRDGKNIKKVATYKAKVLDFHQILEYGRRDFNVRTSFEIGLCNRFECWNTC